MASFKNVTPKKSLGQNLLKDENIARKIAAVLALKPDDTVLEIGAGTGALTKHLLQTGAALVAVEIDSRLFEILRAQFAHEKKIALINKDFLKLNLPELIATSHRWKIVGNLPYFITSQVLFKIFDNCHLFEKAILTMQKEVAQRIVARPFSKDYGILSVHSQYYSEAKRLFDISRKVFFPEPEVTSSVVEFIFKSDKILTQQEEEIFRLVVRKVFSQRRKMLRNSLKTIAVLAAKMDQLNFNLDKRPEQLTVFDFLDLCQQIARLQFK